MLWKAICALSIICALGIPAVFFSMRQSVKLQRQEMIRDLQTVFDLPGDQSEGNIVPSFEFVKYKYFFERKGSPGEILEAVRN